MNRIKVGHVLNSIGGVDVSLRLILENVNTEKFDHFVIHGQADTSKLYLDKDSNQIREYKLPILRDISILNDIRSIIKTITIFRKEKPDIVHAHSAKGGLIARIASITYPVQILHTPQAYSYLSTNNAFKRKVFLFIERMLKRINSVLVASSLSELQRGIKEVGYTKSNTELFNNSILPIPKSPESINYNVSWPSDYICTVGRPSYQKNIEMMVEVVREVKNTIPNIHLVLMGVGEYYPNLESIKKLIDEYELQSNITLVKWIDREEIFKIISKSKLYISTARYEGLPYSIIESLAIAKSCVVTDCDGNRDLIIDEHNGYVIKDQNVLDMSEKVIKLYKDQKLRLTMERNSLKLFRENFDLNNNIGIIEDIYQKYTSNS
ncbi:glycosyltransferase [Aquimarina sp. 2201CG14-23]|uniref:glycosyltransferase n=1 Tax=Aquimarina mycalae TaxID=3040073 RepID=UPI002477E3E1|nr:glycosyltransferase [Aquimarina sp. 2201CG14-23]MDH7446379.1 glycosyltransferase [Aquimarina sp. 2201CG14-23]